MIRSSADIGELATALALAQGEIAPAPKDSINPHFKSKFSDLASCWAVAREPLSKHGLSVVQGPAFDEATGTVAVTTRLMHKSGQWIESDIFCKARTPAPQDIGSAITYLRRYGFCPMVGVVPDDDDDGNKATGHDRGKLQEKKDQRMADAGAARQAQAAVTERQRPPGVFTGSPEQQATVARLLTEKKVPEERWDDVCKMFMGKTLPELPGVITAVLAKEIF